MSITVLTAGGAALVVSAAVLARELRAKRQQAVSFTAADRSLMLEILGEDAYRVAEAVVAVGRQGRTLDPNRVVNGQRKPHNGLDIPGPRGTEVYAVKPSVCVRSGTREGYGEVVELSHLDEPNRSTVYAHLDHRVGDLTLSGVHMIREGDIIAAGDSIGAMGNTGFVGMGVHLHFEVHPTSIPEMGDFNQRLDPLIWLAQQDPPIAIAAERWDGRA